MRHKVTMNLTNPQLVKLKAKGVRNREIAKMINCSPQNISRRLSKYIAQLELLTDAEKMKAFVEKKSDILTATECHILDYLNNPKSLAKASINNLAYALQNVSTMNRLEQGKSTQNIDISALIMRRDELNAKEIDITPPKKPDNPL